MSGKDSGKMVRKWNPDREVWRFVYRKTRRKEKERKLFYKYCLFAFGVPTFITLIDFLIEISPFFSPLLKCAMGRNRCWIGTEWWIELYYIYAPICLILIVSITFYAITAKKIYREQHKSCRYNNDECRTHHNINAHRVRFVNIDANPIWLSFESYFYFLRFFLYFRLFIVMGVTWTLEVLLWFCKSSLFYHLSEMVNLLHLIIILSLFKWAPVIERMQSVTRRLNNIHSFINSV